TPATCASAPGGPGRRPGRRTPPERLYSGQVISLGVEPRLRLWGKQDQARGQFEMRRFAVFMATGVAALAVLGSAAGQSPSPPPADAAFHAGDFAAAAKAYEAALKASPKDAASLAGLASVRLLENRFDQAIALAQRALAAEPANASAQRTLGGAQQRKAA